ncbi:MAG: type II secretion system F family protein [Planctomycetota bacterium]
MAVFEYRALSGAGEPVKGMVTADTAQQARDLLRMQGVYPTGLRETRVGRSGRPALRLPTLFGGGAWERDRVAMTRQLGTLLRSGVPLAQGIDILSRQSRGQTQERILLDLAERIRSGSSLAEALEGHVDRFDRFYIQMVRAGEESGRLDEMLQRLAGYLKERHELNAKISAAMTYPAFMVVVGLAVVTFLLAGVVPKITKVLIEQGGEAALPASTRILLAVSDIFAVWWPLLLLLAAGAWFGVRRALRAPAVRRRWDRWVLCIPVVGELALKTTLSRFVVTFSALLKSGIPAVEGLKLAGSAMGNLVFADLLRDAAERVTHGASLASALGRGGTMPLAVVQMVDVGERTGELPEILDNLAADFDADLEVAIGRITSLIEPVIILVMAVVVGFIALSIIQPIMQMSNIIR